MTWRFHTVRPWDNTAPGRMYAELADRFPQAELSGEAEETIEVGPYLLSIISLPWTFLVISGDRARVGINVAETKLLARFAGFRLPIADKTHRLLAILAKSADLQWAVELIAAELQHEIHRLIDIGLAVSEGEDDDDEPIVWVEAYVRPSNRRASIAHRAVTDRVVASELYPRQIYGVNTLLRFV